MDGVKVALGNRGMTVEVERQGAIDRKENKKKRKKKCLLKLKTFDITMSTYIS